MTMTATTSSATTAALSELDVSRNTTAWEGWESCQPAFHRTPRSLRADPLSVKYFVLL
jgi:hypothetical protein